MCRATSSLTSDILTLYTKCHSKYIDKNRLPCCHSTRTLSNVNISIIIIFLWMNDHQKKKCWPYVLLLLAFFCSRNIYRLLRMFVLTLVIITVLFWQECPKCHVTIEKDGGCNHMVCRNQNCKAEFCWVCLGPWEPHGSAW